MYCVCHAGVFVVLVLAHDICDGCVYYDHLDSLWNP